jgi:hypothetical protein
VGRYYCGPYAAQLGGEHEGFAAHVLQGGRVFIGWSEETEGFIAYVAACECGWRGDLYDPTDDGAQDALEEWTREHMLPLIVAAARDGWQDWVTRIAYRAAEIATAVTCGHPEPVVEVMKALAADVAGWQRVLEQVVEERAMARGER